jgi:hypothetical protein
MVALLAQIRTDAPILDERSAARRTLRLQVPTSLSGDATEALIHNLSEAGLLVETGAELQVGEALQIELPHAGGATAIVVWTRGSFAGCEFAAPISKAAVSAALLLAPVQVAADRADVIREPSVPSIDRRDLPDDLGVTSGAMVMVSLLVGLVIATLLGLALLTLPFSLY